MKNPAEVHNIIYNTLSSYLSSNELTEAITIWEENYSKLSQLRLNAYMNDIKDLGSVQENKQLIYRLITKQLLEDGLTTREVVDKTQKASDDNLCCTFIVFAKHMLSEIRSDQQSIAISHVQTLLRSKKTSSKDIKDIITALKTPASAQCDIPAKVLRQAINQIYMVLCEVIGPVQADSILNKAVTKTTEETGSIKKLI